MKPAAILLKTAFVLCFINSNVGPYISHAQERDAPGSDETQLIKTILEVLSSTAEEAKKWDDKAVAARTQAQIADLLWDANRENAIDYLKEAWSAATKVEEPKRDRSAFVNPSRRNAVRREILLVARKRVPQLAAIWLEEVVEESRSAEKERGTFDDRSARSAVLLQMANEIVANDAKGAAELLIESLRDGVSFNFQTTLIRIQQQNPALAETVFRAALARLRAAGMSDPNEILTLYAYLYTPGRVFGANTSDNRNQIQLVVGGSHVSTPAGRQNPALAREFLEVASDLLLSAPLPDTTNAQLAARSWVSTIGILMREVTQELPEKAALLRARAQQLDSEARFSYAPIRRSPDIPETRPGESKESFAERRVDLLEETAAKGRDVLTRDIGYATAAVATSAERYERGLDLAGKIDDKNLRNGVRSWLIYRAVLHFIGSGNLDNAYALNSRNDDPLQRAACLIVGAQKLVKAEDINRANEWLREAGALVRRSDPSEGLSRVTLGLVSTYGQFDTQAAFDWLLYAVRLMRKTPVVSLNEDQAPQLTRISGITPVSGLTGNTAGFSLQAAVAVFPPDQFQQVLYALNEISSPEARGIAVVTLCSNLLKTIPDAMKKLSQPRPSIPATRR
jgi:hypothetical protein